MKRGLVLGCGGVAGGAWTIATLHHLQQQLDWDVRDAEIIVGTSAGAVIASLLGAGVSVEQLMACQKGLGDCQWDHDHDTGGALPPLPKLNFTAAKLLAKGLRGEISALTMASGLAPVGQFDMAPFRRLIDDVVPAGEWAPRDGIWLMAVDIETGKRTAFGRSDAPKAALNDAMCASYGVPGWCPPVAIGGKSYIDGGVASPASADLLADSDVDEVILLAPMASTDLDKPRSPLARIERRVRAHMTRIVDKEVALLEAAGKKVTRLHPNAKVLEAIGYNMMDPKRRELVFKASMELA